VQSCQTSPVQLFSLQQLFFVCENILKVGRSLGNVMFNTTGKQKVWRTFSIPIRSVNHTKVDHRVLNEQAWISLKVQNNPSSSFVVPSRVSRYCPPNVNALQQRTPHTFAQTTPLHPTSPPHSRQRTHQTQLASYLHTSQQRRNTFDPSPGLCNSISSEPEPEVVPYIFHGDLSHSSSTASV
jgi:hypothetical protein